MTRPAMDRGTFETFQRSIDPDWIEQALTETKKATTRKRRLPADQVVWLVLGMALFRDLAIDAVVKTLDLALFDRHDRPMSGSSVCEARQRLGREPLVWLFERCAKKWAVESADKQRWRGLAVYGVDGTKVRVPDSDVNRRHFGGHASSRGESGYPLVRVVTLMALRSHLLLAARFGPYRTSELAYAEKLWPEVPENSIVILDRNFLNAPVLLPLQSEVANRHWLTRAKSNTKHTVVETLGAGDELVELTVSAEARKKNPDFPKKWRVRVIHYQRPGYRPERLLTSLLDAKRFPAAEIIALYHERWELELGYDELKTEILEREETIRSRSIDGVDQELWGLLLAYNLVRLEMERVADEAKVLPTRISFIAAFHYIRHALMVAGFLKPGALPKHVRRLREDLLGLILPERRSERLFPRAVKIKMSNYPRKRRAPLPPSAPVKS